MKKLGALRPGAFFAKKTSEASGARAGTAAVSISFVRFSVKEQTLFAKRLSFLVKAGVPLLECMHLIRKQTRSRGKRAVYDTVIQDLANGQYLATSLQKHRRLFGDFAINLIRVGELSGVLTQNLSYLADELSKKHALQRKVIGALIYPVFITVATLGVTSLITAYIFPKLMPIFISLHVTLPLTTRILIAVSDYLRHWGILTVFAFIAFLTALLFVRGWSDTLRYWGDRMLLRLPIAGSIARSYNLANFTRTLGLLLHSGVHLTEALTIVSRTTKNLAYKRACARLGDGVIKGERISKGLEAQPRLYPDLLTHMVAIGETTGNLSATLTYLSDLYEGEVEEQTKSLSSSIEPVLMIVMGLLVGLIAVSVITPIYAITQHLQPK